MATDNDTAVLDDVFGPLGSDRDSRPSHEDEAHGYAAGLRALAELVEAKPAAYETWMTVSHSLPVHSAKEMARTALAIGGKWEKVSIGSFFYLHQDLGGGVKVKIFTERGNVCERVQVGTETQMVAPEGVELVAKEVPVYEWHCPDSFLSMAKQAGVSDGE